ncbi:MAG: Wzz/FepE/Etk N-terminal domain-containing protein [Candidatus Pseudomonas phytovorans]|uniref:Wzz/FepE/Etk N-terminal domain-containing protein n=1 Tax=Candidatus Pseudomonas phytovorans TaxID=3121377 RepID=A0AAJ5WHB4_9PSED|nr:Wzz/FepE/Etk N-terminal domain-containing protein [Pseudomonas sp.]WEK29789.1 MAG: Wzz/FepE/Etk N-terminal domain-containing protein [Pseudomonas sp.]
MRNERSREVGNDDFDVLELWHVLWSRKLLIVSCVILVTAIAFIYTSLKTPLYEAKSFILPPTKNDLAQLNYGRTEASGLEVFKPKDVYEIYLRSLQSESLRRQFFRGVYLPNLPEAVRQGSQDALYDQFGKVLTVGPVAGGDAERIVIRALSDDPSTSAKWVTRFSEMASDRAKKTLVEDADTEVKVLVKNLEQQVRSARDAAHKQREDQIARLEEALKVAKAVNLSKPPIIASGLNTEVSGGMQGALTYMRGSQALEAELANLRARQSDDPFVAELREVQEKLDFYRNLQVNAAVIEVFQQDGAIEVPDSPVRLRKLLIILGGAFVGLTLGVLLASLSHLVSAERSRRLARD